MVEMVSVDIIMNKLSIQHVNVTLQRICVDRRRGAGYFYCT
jgi:hypothetical protein